MVGEGIARSGPLGDDPTVLPFDRHAIGCEQTSQPGAGEAVEHQTLLLHVDGRVGRGEDSFLTPKAPQEATDGTFGVDGPCVLPSLEAAVGVENKIEQSTHTVFLPETFDSERGHGHARLRGAADAISTAGLRSPQPWSAAVALFAQG
ncbi:MULTISPECIES: hypothetical protein [Streptomyces]|uniref:hypothetical protein n=1 Tax=Streptomyces TaxID=1883 RepID=UPI0005BA2567|nr:MULTISPECIES: hypothetical protein [Streptomyces]